MKKHISKISLYIWKLIIIGYIGCSVLTLFLVYRCWLNDGIDNARKLDSKLETEIAYHIPQKELILDINGWLRNAMGANEMNGVIKMKNGHLVFTQGASTSEDTLKEYATNIEKLSNYLREESICFLYVNTPYQVANSKDLPPGHRDCSNANSDLFINILENMEINCLDLRKSFVDSGLNQYDYFFRTDHHWTMRGGMFATKKINDWLSMNLECEVDERVTDSAYYDIETIQAIHLGSTGLRVGKGFAGGADDFDVYYPKFEINLIGDDDIEITDMHQYYNIQEIDAKDFSSSFYDRFLANPSKKYVNNNAYNDKKILIISDSMGMAVYPFLNNSFREVRRVGCSSLTKDLLDDYRPDAVIVMYYPIELSENKFEYFDFAVLN